MLLSIRVLIILVISLIVGAMLYYCRNIFDKNDNMDNINNIINIDAIKEGIHTRIDPVLDLIKPEPNSSILTAKIPQEIIKNVVTDVIKTVPDVITKEIIKHVPQDIINKAVPSCKKLEEVYIRYGDNEQIDSDDGMLWDADVPKCYRNKRKLNNSDFTTKIYDYTPDIILQS
jgi:hypothetical protein